MLGEPIRDRRAERHEATRAEILDAAWAIARDEGLGAVALREIARRIGMQAPSLYSYFRSKNDLYDAMFAQAWTDVLDSKPDAGSLPAEPRAAIKAIAHFYFDWARADPARYLITSQRVIPGFAPSPEAYAPAVQVMEDTLREFDRLGIPTDAIDLYTAIVGGLAAQQVANDPGGNRWKPQVDRAMDAFCDYVGVPATKSRARARGKK
ncbi:MAG: TetR/AcrR family transcriptional regulator [Actinomycetes bacterium]